ncbi:hypothetical protein ACLKA7_012418 [Drosophila subpalustris]
MLSLTGLINSGGLALVECSPANLLLSGWLYRSTGLSGQCCQLFTKIKKLFLTGEKGGRQILRADLILVRVIFAKP